VNVAGGRWLDRELDALRPRLVVALGSAAARALPRRNVSVTRERVPAAFRQVARLRHRRMRALAAVDDGEAVTP